MTAWVLDTSAVLAYLWQEPGWERVEEVLTGGEPLISTVNLAELAGRAAEAGMAGPDIASLVAGLKLAAQPFGAADALAAGLLRPATRHLGLSLGDRACLALARSRGVPALTTDRAWTRLPPDCGVRVECIRPDPAGA